jgi:stage II sporulation protein AB (anti-sigma F factor)
LGYLEYRMLSPGQSLSRCYDACPESVTRARAELTAFATRAGAEGEELDSIRLAVSEAVSNSVLHAYDRPGGTVTLAATYVTGELWVFVGDHGAGFRVRPNGGGLGLGLALIAQLADDFQILSRGSGGTELRMQFKLAPVKRPDQPERGSVASAV